MIKYLVPALLASFADWLQGPFLYDVYVSYGYTPIVISRFMLCGFVSSMTLGTYIVGKFEKFGPKVLCLLYCVMCGLSCSMLHCEDVICLVLGRMFGGISTSLLFSSFDSWMIKEYKKLKLDNLKRVFRVHAFCNSLMAIFSGVVCSYLEAISTSPFAPFNLAICVCIVCFFAIYLLWNDDVLQNSSRIDTPTIRTASITQEPNIMLVGAVMALYEASMYMFIFMWAPLLSEDTDISLGNIFAIFMTCSMIGSQFAGGKLTLVLALVAAAISHACIVLLPHYSLCAMSVFEFTVGMYFSTMGTIKSDIITDKHRSAVYAQLRIPLNLAVVLLLAVGTSSQSYFKITTVMLIIATVIASKISHTQKRE